MNIPGLDDITPEERRGIDLAKSELDLIRQLVELRKTAGIKPAELARMMGVDRAFVTRFEAGGTNPTMATINRYAEAIGAMITYKAQPHQQWVTETVSSRATKRLTESVQLSAEHTDELLAMMNPVPSRKPPHANAGARWARHLAIADTVDAK